jgi:hypothetical protein
LTSDFCLEREMTLTEAFAVLPDPRTGLRSGTI